MGLILIVLFFIVEAACAVVSISKKYEKKEWSKLRFVARAAELLVLLAFVLTPLADLGMRFFVCFIWLLLRVVISVVVALIARNSTKNISAVRIVCSTLFSLVLISLTLVPAFVFTGYTGLETSGEYAIAETSCILVDNSREETFETDGSKREVPMHMFYPETDGSEQFPLIVFSHGAFGYYQSNMSVYQELASNGYVVLALDHPYHAMYTSDTEGKTITVDPMFMQNVMRINSDQTPESEIFRVTTEWMELRCADVNFVLDACIDAKANGLKPETWFASEEELAVIDSVLKKTDCDTIGLMGHSLGGATSVTVGRMRNDVDAVIDLDGTMLGEQLDYQNDTYQYYEESYPIPLLEIQAEDHYEQAKEYDILYVNQKVMQNAQDGRCTYFKQSDHMNFTDLPLFSPVLAKMLGVGAIDPEACIKQVNEIVLSYYDYYLKNEGELVLKECY